MSLSQLVSYDTSTKKITSEIPPDCISNLQWFINKNNDNPMVLNNLRSEYGDTWIDNSDYSNYPTIEEIIQNYDPIQYKNKSFVCRVDMKYVFTSDKSVRGYDRLSEINHHQCVNSLNENDKLGFDDNKADTLNGHLRPYKGKWVLVKNKGNHRMYMKLLSRFGESSEVLMKIRFHEEGLPNDSYVTLEAEPQHADARDRAGQNEKQKFHSGFRGNRSDLKYAYEFLKKNKLNFDNIMTLEGETGADKWASLSSLSKLNQGEGNGLFRNPGFPHITNAISILKKVAKEHTYEDVIQTSAIEGLGRMYRYLTEDVVGQDGRTLSAPLTKKQLDNFFLSVFKYRNQVSSHSMYEDRNKLKIKDLAKSGGFKDISAICIKAFWRDLYKFYITECKDGNNYGIGFATRQVKNFYETVEKENKTECKRILSNFDD